MSASGMTMAGRTVLNHEIVTKLNRKHATGLISEHPSLRRYENGDGSVKKADGVSATGGSDCVLVCATHLMMENGGA